MLEIIFNFFNKTKLFIKKNRKILCFLALGSLFLLAPFQSVKAGIWDDILSAVANIYTLPIKIGIVASVIMCLLSFLFAGISASILYIVLVFIANIMITYSLDVPISPVHPDHETIQVVVDSWNFVNNFVGMFFALTLAFIGLATILRIKDHEAKQLLPKLLTIAVLINFAPVIIGIIVDMGNIVTNFFIGKAGFDITDLTGLWKNTLEPLFNLEDIAEYFLSLPGQILGSPAIVLGEGIKILGQMLIGIIFVLASIYVYLCITGMFFLRVIMLWTLTILSPIAFFSYIIPSGSPLRRLFPGILSWEKWWEEFLQWVIVGIPFGLFFYISNAIFNSTAGGGVSVPPLEEQLQSLGSGINFQSLLIQDFLGPIMGLFVHALALMMLYRGYKISMQAAPAMAQAMVKNTQKLIKTAAIMAATAGAGALAGAAGSAAGTLGSKVGGIGTKMMGSKSKVIQGFGKRMNKVAKPIGNLIKQGGQKIDVWNSKNKPKLSDAVKNLSDDGQIEDGEGKSLYQRMLRVRNADLSKLSPENREKAQQTIEEASKKPRFRDEFKDVTKKAAKNDIYSKEIGMNLGDITQEDIDEKIEDIQEKIGEDNLKLEFADRLGLDADSNKEEFENFKQDFAAKTINFQKMKSLKDLGNKSKTSMEYRVASHGRSSETIADAQKTLNPEELKEFLHGTGGVISTYDSKKGMKDLGSKNEGLLLDILTQGRFANIDFKQRDRDDIQHAPGTNKKGIDRKAVREILKKYKAEQSLDVDKVKEPKGIHISNEDIDKTALNIVDELLSGDPDPKLYKEADEAAKASGFTGIKDSGSSAFDSFLKKYANAEAKRRLVKEKEELQKTPIRKAKKGRLEEQMPTMKTFDIKKKEEKLEKLEERKKSLEKKKAGIKIDKEKDTYGEQAKKKTTEFAIEKRIQLIEKRKEKLEKGIRGLQSKMDDISQGKSIGKKEKKFVHKPSPYRAFANDSLKKDRELKEKTSELESLAIRINKIPEELKRATSGHETIKLTKELEASKKGYSKLEKDVTSKKKDLEERLKHEPKFQELENNFKKANAYKKEVQNLLKKASRGLRGAKKSEVEKIKDQLKKIEDTNNEVQKIIKEKLDGKDYKEVVDKVETSIVSTDSALKAIEKNKNNLYK